jgi:hypothetical protein
MPSPRPPGVRRGRTLTIELPEALKAAIEAAAAARGQTLAEWTRQALAAAAAPEAQPPGPLQLQALAERLEGIAARLEALERRRGKL